MTTKPRSGVSGRSGGSQRRPSGRDPLGERAHERIREAIQDGRLAPGSRVRENEVAEWLGMSRTPVREAIFRLEAEGLLTHCSRQGLTVATLDYQAVIELYAMREVLEGTAGRLAALHASDAEVETLREMIEIEREVSSEDAVRATQANRRFHQLLHHAAHNRYLLKSLNALGDAMILLGHTTLALPGRHTTALKEHAALYEAVERRDPEAAEEAARRHIRGAQRYRLKMLLNDDDGRNDVPPAVVDD